MRYEDELEAERLAKWKMHDVPVEEFHPRDNSDVIVFDGSAVALGE